MFKEGAIIGAEYHPDRGKYTQSVCGRVVERDGHTLTIEELDHQGVRTKEHRRVRLHAPSQETTSLTEHRDISLGTLYRIDFYASAETAEDAVSRGLGMNEVSAAMNAHIQNQYRDRIIHEERGLYRYPRVRWRQI